MYSSTVTFIDWSIFLTFKFKNIKKYNLYLPDLTESVVYREKLECDISVMCAPYGCCPS